MVDLVDKKDLEKMKEHARYCHGIKYRIEEAGTLPDSETLNGSDIVEYTFSESEWADALKEGFNTTP